jgi:sialic acid synthase SpsE
MDPKKINYLTINNIEIGGKNPAYFIADIAANHDGDLQRAISLIHAAAEAGADAAKFQHFRAETIVSDFGFKSLGLQKSHQANWKKSVFDIYKDASVNLDWTPYLKEACDKSGIAFFTSPYEINLVDEIDKFVPAYKIGSGDITWHELISHIASKNKPYILASGASKLEDVKTAIDVGLSINPNLALLQCNTNYTSSLENFKYINLNVLKTYRELYPHMVLGLSDHTPGHATVLGAITLGAKIIEKHFTDNQHRVGPDHKFSMNPMSWREMVDRSRELEMSLGDGLKRVEENESETVVLQRRSLCARVNLRKGEILRRDMLIPLRPCPVGAIEPNLIEQVIGKKLNRVLIAGDQVKWSDLK